jgi:hypothetical protein
VSEHKAKYVGTRERRRATQPRRKSNAPFIYFMTFNELLFMRHQLSRNQHQKVTARAVRFTARCRLSTWKKYNPQGAQEIFESYFLLVCIFLSFSLLTPCRAQPTCPKETRICGTHLLPLPADDINFGYYTNDCNLFSISNE